MTLLSPRRMVRHYDHHVMSSCLKTFILLVFLPISLWAAPNIILVIGDGMGTATITASRLYAGGSTNNLVLDTFPVVGHVKTYSANQFVTDSAAAGTALATGHKTTNGTVGLDPQGKLLSTLIDEAKAKGYRTGILTNTAVTDATPAAFYAHVPNRKQQREIAEWLPSSNLDFLMGGGQVFFDSATRQRLHTKGWTIVTTLTPFEKLVQIPFLGLLAPNDMAYEALRQDQKSDEPSLTQMTRYALKALQKNASTPFFLVIESGLIDRAEHRNLFKYTMKEMQILNEVLREISMIPETLIIVTADHETGGLSLSGYADIQAAQGDRLATQKIETGRIVNWATGPSVILHNEKIRNSGTLPVEITEDELSTEEALATQSAAHTAVDVPIFAKGPGQTLFSGTMDNTEVAQKIKSLLKTQKK